MKDMTSVFLLCLSHVNRYTEVRRTSLLVTAKIIGDQSWRKSPNLIFKYWEKSALLCDNIPERVWKPHHLIASTDANKEKSSMASKTDHGDKGFSWNSKFTQRRFRAKHVNWKWNLFPFSMLCGAKRLYSSTQTICPKIWPLPLPKNANISLPVDLCRSEPPLLKLLNTPRMRFMWCILRRSDYYDVTSTRSLFTLST